MRIANSKGTYQQFLEEVEGLKRVPGMNTWINSDGTKIVRPFPMRYPVANKNAQTLPCCTIKSDNDTLHNINTSKRSGMIQRRKSITAIIASNMAGTIYCHHCIPIKPPQITIIYIQMYHIVEIVASVFTKPVPALPGNGHCP